MSVSSFDKFTVRKVSEADRSYLNQVIAADPFHRWNMTADFFLKTRRGEDAWAVEDEQGKVVLYFKTQTAVRFSCIFPNSSTRREKATNARVLRYGLNWITNLLGLNGYGEIITDTANPDLAKFTKLVLGFTSLTEQLSKLVPTDDTPKEEKKSREALPEFSEGGYYHVRIQ